MEEKVIKCSNEQCGLYFGYSEKDTKCPFCQTEYVEMFEGEAKENKETKKKKETVKANKESFKMDW